MPSPIHHTAADPIAVQQDPRAQLARFLGSDIEGTVARASTFDWTFDPERDGWLVNLPLNTAGAHSTGLVRWDANGLLDFSLLPDEMAACLLEQAPQSHSYGLRSASPKRDAYLVPTVLDALVMQVTGRRAFTLTPAAAGEISADVVADIVEAKLTTVIVIGVAGARGECEATALAATLAHHPVIKDKNVAVKLFRWADGLPMGESLADAYADVQHDAPEFDALLNKRWLQLPLPIAPALGGMYLPKGAAFRTPEGYVLGKSGVARNSLDRKGKPVQDVVCPTPLWIGGTYSNASEGSDVAVQLCAEVAGRMVRRVVPIAELASSHKIPALAGAGFVGCTSTHAEEIVRYITAAYLENFAHLPRVSTVRHVGTTAGGHHREPQAFVFNGQCFDKSGVAESVELARADGSQDYWDAYTVAGEAAEWTKLLVMLRRNRFDVPYMMLCATVASMLNRPLGITPYIVQAAGEAAKGKTLALKFALSAQGSPRAVGSARATLASLEPQLEFAHDLAVPLDEIQSMATGNHGDATIESFVYMISEGMGRNRMSRTGGTQARRRWSCNVIATGERDLTTISVSGNTGSKRRVISAFGAPFGTPSSNTATMLRQMTDIAAENYGHAVERIGRLLVTASPERWRGWRADLRTVEQRYIDEAPEGCDAGLVGSMAPAFAAMELGGVLLDEVLAAELEELKAAEPIPTPDVMLASVWRDTIRRLSVSGRALRALEVVNGYLSQHLGSFDGVGKADASVDSDRTNTRLGKVYPAYVAFLPGPLKKHLGEHDFTLATEQALWLGKGWLVPDKKGNAQMSVTVNGHKSRCVCIRRDVLEADDPESVIPERTKRLAEQTTFNSL